MRHRKQKFTTEQIREALQATHGLVHIAARKLRCHHSTIYRRLEDDPSLQELVDDLRGEMYDIAMSRLYEAVKRGEPWAVMYTLRRFGKSRGYTTKVDSKGMSPRIKVMQSKISKNKDANKGR